LDSEAQGRLENQTGFACSELCLLQLLGGGRLLVLADSVPAGVAGEAAEEFDCFLLPGLVVLADSVPVGVAGEIAEEFDCFLLPGLVVLADSVPVGVAGEIAEEIDCCLLPGLVAMGAPVVLDKRLE
jgi:hypothetical protein